MMGCDIHAYIEYADHAKDDKPLYWKGFGGSINPGRNYAMFGILAGVRTGEQPLYPAKGLPEDGLSYEATEDAYCVINEALAGHENYVSLATAEGWAKHGAPIENKDGKPWRIPHPDWHGHTWLTLGEYEDVLEAFRERYSDPKFDYGLPCYLGIAGAMRSLANAGQHVRLVIWFDN